MKEDSRYHIQAPHVFSCLIFHSADAARAVAIALNLAFGDN